MRPVFRLPVLLTLVAVITAPPLHGQFARQYVALAGGATYSDLTNYTVSTDWRWGATAGVMAGIVTFDYSYVELAPSWAQMGGRIEALDADLRLDYVDIPLMLGGMIPMGSADALARLYAGVSLGLKVSCGAEPAVCDVARGSVWSLPVGLSFAKVIGGRRFIGVDARYQIGLSDVFEITEATQRSWQFRAFFGLPLGSR